MFYIGSGGLWGITKVNIMNAPVAISVLFTHLGNRGKGEGRVCETLPHFKNRYFYKCTCSN